MNIKEILAKLTIEELRQIKENPYIIDELIYEKQMDEQRKMLVSLNDPYGFAEGLSVGEQIDLRR